jgi:hypothetical protein
VMIDKGSGTHFWHNCELLEQPLAT